MAEQSTPDSTSDSSLMERMSAAFEPAPEAVPEPQAEPAEAATATADEAAPEADDQQPEAPPEDDGLVEYQDDDGETYKVPAKFKDAHIRYKDWTQDKQQMATMREAAQDRMHFAEAKEQFVTSVMQDVAEHRVLQAQVAQYDALDWDNMEPGQAFKYSRQRDALARQADEKARAIQSKAAQFQQVQPQHEDRQWQLAVQGAAHKIGKVTPEVGQAMEKLLFHDLGFTEKELKSRFADPRFLQAIHIAAQQKVLQSQKPSALKAVQKAPPVVKPGASKGPGVAAQQNYRDLRTKLKSTGSDKDALKLLRLIG